jgi:hypothetical protein
MVEMCSEVWCLLLQAALMVCVPLRTTDQRRGYNEMPWNPGLDFQRILSARNDTSPSDFERYTQNQPMGSGQVFKFESLDHFDFEALEVQLKTLGKRQSRLFIKIWW